MLACAASLAAVMAHGLEGFLFKGIGWRDIFFLLLPFALAIFIPCLYIGDALIATYDSDALQDQPPAEFKAQSSGLLNPGQTAIWKDLLFWCFNGVGSGRWSAWRPWKPTDVAIRFAVAAIKTPINSSLLQTMDAFARHMDGNDRLDKMPTPWARLKMKLETKAFDCMWWRNRHGSDPWDSGYVLFGATTPSKLSQFTPRRATLLIAVGLPEALLKIYIAALHEQQKRYRHPVRLLVLSDEFTTERLAVPVTIIQMH